MCVLSTIITMGNNDPNVQKVIGFGLRLLYLRRVGGVRIEGS